MSTHTKAHVPANDYVPVCKQLLYKLLMRLNDEKHLNVVFV